MSTLSFLSVYFLHPLFSNSPHNSFFREFCLLVCACLVNSHNNARLDSNNLESISRLFLVVPVKAHRSQEKLPFFLIFTRKTEYLFGSVCDAHIIPKKVSKSYMSINVPFPHFLPISPSPSPSQDIGVVQSKGRKFCHLEQ